MLCKCTVSYYCAVNPTSEKVNALLVSTVVVATTTGVGCVVVTSLVVRFLCVLLRAWKRKSPLALE